MQTSDQTSAIGGSFDLLLQYPPDALSADFLDPLLTELDSFRRQRFGRADGAKVRPLGALNLPLPLLWALDQ